MEHVANKYLTTSEPEAMGAHSTTDPGLDIAHAALQSGACVKGWLLNVESVQNLDWILLGVCKTWTRFTCLPASLQRTRCMHYKQ